MTNLDADNLSHLKAEMERLLRGDIMDFQGVLEVSSKMARLDADNVRFTTDAAMVRRLGRELVAKQETALAELVKNAFDADATVCTVTIGDGVMQIVDDGSGMSRSQIENGFMRLASDYKVDEPVSQRYGRSRAGRKGIGRFATERLGAILNITTQTEAEEEAWVVTIDWTTFEQGLDLNLVQNQIGQAPKEKPHGTRLEILRLADTWSDSELRRVYRYLSTLMEPDFSGSVAIGQGTNRSQGYHLDPGFRVELRQEGSAGNATIVNADTEILGKALAVIHGEVDFEGNAAWSITSDRTDYDFSVDSQPISLDRKEIKPLLHAKNVSLTAHYFIRSREFLGHSTSFIGRQLDANGGIRVYRNGYRVPPYGDPEDDWLDLDSKKSIYAPISTGNFIGYVTLTDIDGTHFEETSSREGLIDTPAFREVREIMGDILEAAVRRIESVRGKGRDRDRGRGGLKEEDSGKKAADDAEAAVTRLQDIVEGIESEGDVSPLDIDDLRGAVTALARVTKVASEAARERDDFLKELNLVRILASMGLTIAEFTHDFSHFSQGMLLSVGELQRSADGPREEFFTNLNNFAAQSEQMHAYIGHIGTMMAHNSTRELQYIDLYQFSRDFISSFGLMFSRRGLEFTVERPNGFDIFTEKMHRSEWSSILLNLLTNSIKAAARAHRAGRFMITVGRADEQNVFLEFSDNGDGIPTENRDRVFDAFFTTGGGSGSGGSEVARALGTGLGLKIVADLIQAASGTVSIVEPHEGYTTTIRIVVPAGHPGIDFGGNS